MVGFHSATAGGKALLLTDLDLIKQIFIKDFDHFQHMRIGGSKFDFGHEGLNNMLFIAEEDVWRETRHASSPIFTSGKLKKMSKIMHKVALDLVGHLHKLAASGEEVNARELTSKFTITIIANAGFGIDANCFEDCPRSEQFSDMALKFTGANRPAWEILRFFLASLFPKFLAKIIGGEVVPPDALKFFESIIDQRLNMKKAAANRDDMVDIITDTLRGDAAKNGGNPEEAAMREDKVEMLLKSNLYTMFFAGMEPPSAMMAACLFFLARNQEVQERLFQEISDANLGDKLDYNTFMNLEYLDMVVQETMRHNAIVDPQRCCSKDYKVPGTNFTIPKGMTVFIPAHGIMMDERYFANPTRFDPEHFSPENKEGRNPGTDLGFGFGARKCIGSRLALLQWKTGVAFAVQKFRILPTARTPERLELDPKSGSTQIKGGIWIKFEERA